MRVYNIRFWSWSFFKKKLGEGGGHFSLDNNQSLIILYDFKSFHFTFEALKLLIPKKYFFSLQIYCARYFLPHAL